MRRSLRVDEDSADSNDSKIPYSNDTGQPSTYPVDRSSATRTSSDALGVSGFDTFTPTSSSTARTSRRVAHRHGAVISEAFALASE